MQPTANSIWFAKMKDSRKILIVSDEDKDIIENNILSTGFCGISESDNLSLTLLVAFVISSSFKIQRDLNSVGTTMAGVNNETLLKIEVPFLSKEENKEFDHRYRPLANNLSLIRRKINLLKREKEILLKIFF